MPPIEIPNVSQALRPPDQNLFRGLLPPCNQLKTKIYYFLFFVPVLLGHSANIVQEEKGEEMVAVREVVPPVVPHIFETEDSS